MNTLNLSTRYSADFLRSEAEKEAGYAFGVWHAYTHGETLHIQYPEDLGPLMARVVATYDTRLLYQLKEAKLVDLEAKRWAASQSFTYDGVKTHADPAIGVVAATLLQRTRAQVPAEVTQKWKLGRGEFRDWTEANIEAFGFAIGAHIQACFDHEEGLSNAIIAATTELELVSININEGWPI